MGNAVFPLGLRYKGEGNMNTSHFNRDRHSSDAMPGSIVDPQILSLFAFFHCIDICNY